MLNINKLYFNENDFIHEILIPDGVFVHLNINIFTLSGINVFHVSACNSIILFTFAICFLKKS
jgi:hypothetical protein